jgi:hypothetical protein
MSRTQAEHGRLDCIKTHGELAPGTSLALKTDAICAVPAYLVAQESDPGNLKRHICARFAPMRRLPIVNTAILS